MLLTFHTFSALPSAVSGFLGCLSLLCCCWWRCNISPTLSSHTKTKHKLTHRTLRAKNFLLLFLSPTVLPEKNLIPQKITVANLTFLWFYVSGLQIRCCTNSLYYFANVRPRRPPNLFFHHHQRSSRFEKSTTMVEVARVLQIPHKLSIHTQKKKKMLPAPLRGQCFWPKTTATSFTLPSHSLTFLVFSLMPVAKSFLPMCKRRRWWPQSNPSLCLWQIPSFKHFCALLF